jgi:hypothetical protein
MANDKHPRRDARADQRDEAIDIPDSTQDSSTDPPNPPRTTAGGLTAPKFGSAGSGGAELEPGPERD